MDRLQRTLEQAGFRGEALRTAWAVAMRESGGNPRAYNPNRSTGDDSHGLFQINMLGSMGADRDAKFRQHVKGYTGPDSLMDPLVNARAAYYMTNKGQNWYHWDIDSSGYDGGSHAGKYREWLAKYPGGNVATTKGQQADAARKQAQAMLPRTAEAAIQWATTSNQQYNNQCDHFVGLAYGLPHSNYQSAIAHWDAIPQKFKTADEDAPVGSLVFWRTGKWGHVAIVTGADKKGNAIVTTTHANNGRPTKMLLKDINRGSMQYLGWTPPYFQGRTAEIDGYSSGVYSRPDSMADDYSGVDSRTDEEVLRGDTLNWKDMAARYGYAESLLTSVPELKDLFKEAADTDATDQDIVARIKSTEWYKNNNEYVRQYEMQKAAGGQDFVALQDNARTQVDLWAQEVGAALDPNQREILATRYMTEGWGEREGGTEMGKAAMSEFIQMNDTGFLSGQAGNIQEQLAAVAKNNGIQLTDAFFTSAAKSVNSNLRTMEDWERDIRSQAASAWPPYSEQIMAGADVKDLISAYTDSMSQILELDRDTIDLNDPILREAMTRVDDKGNPNPVGLYEFSVNLRKRPEWMQTKNAQDKMASIASDVARMFGFTG